MRQGLIKNIFVGFILLILVISAFIILRNFRSLDHSNQTNGVIITTPKRITDASASIKYTIDVSYPSFSGLSNTDTETNINSLIQKQIESDIAAFKQEVDQTEQSFGGNVPIDIEKEINELFITFDVIRADDKIVSVQFKIADYQAGMDHPNNYNTVFNYNVLTDKRLTLADIFDVQSDYLSQLSTLSREQLSKRLSDNPYAGEFINDGTTPVAENFQLVTLGPREINVIFDPYQVAPYYEGSQIVSIPYNSLKPVLNKSFTF